MFRTVRYVARVVYCGVCCSCFVLLCIMLVFCTVRYVARVLYY